MVCRFVWIAVLTIFQTYNKSKLDNKIEKSNEYYLQPTTLAVDQRRPVDITGRKSYTEHSDVIFGNQWNKQTVKRSTMDFLPHTCF